jgi:hypothetical protein
MRTELLQSPLRTPQRKKWMLKDTYTGNSGERRRGQQCLPVTRPEVVLPTYMASAFGLDKGVSLADNRN